MRKRVKYVNALMWKNMPCRTSLKYKHSIQFRKENADVTTIASFYVKLPFWQKSWFCTVLKHMINFKYLLNWSSKRSIIIFDMTTKLEMDLCVCLKLILYLNSLLSWGQSEEEWCINPHVHWPRCFLLWFTSLWKFALKHQDSYFWDK